MVVMPHAYDWHRKFLFDGKSYEKVLEEALAKISRTLLMDYKYRVTLKVFFMLAVSIVGISILCVRWFT